MTELSLQMIKFAGLAGLFTAVTSAVYVTMRSRSQRVAVRSGLHEAILASSSVAASRTAVMKGPFAQRVLGPATKKAANIVGRFGPVGLAENTRKRLVLAGLGDRIDVDSFLAAALVIPIAVTCLLVALGATGELAPIAWFAIPLSAFAPKIWLTSRVETRQKKIRLALPDTLDLLTIAVEAGLGFDSALARVVASIPGPLSDELYRMLQEIKIGVPRTQALRNLAERTDVHELDAFITALTQADTFGIAIGNVLRVQAEQLRKKRSQLAEERAAKTPVKLLFPLVFCIFPGLFTVLVGPAVISIAKNLIGKI